MAAKMSIIIPTIQRTGVILQKLLEVLSQDNAVDEIILIDNTQKGYDCNLSKVNVVIPKENMFVNPAWNWGIKNMKNSFFGLINDDVIVPLNYCTDVLNFLLKNKNIGLLGYDSNDKVLYRDMRAFNVPPPNTKMRPTPLYRNSELNFWGSTIFGHKSNYYEIPEDIKIYCGDNYILLKNKEKLKPNYQVNNQLIKHFGSMSANPNSQPYIISDLEKYAKFEPDILKNKAYLRLKQQG